MDPAEYMPMFLAESREHLQQLNVAIVALEKSPEDTAVVDEIFRVAHSVKGMSGTMGFEGMTELSHEMEEVFEVIRQRRGAIEREVADVLLECLDALSAAVDAIERDGEEHMDNAALIARLRSLVRAPGERGGAGAEEAAPEGAGGGAAAARPGSVIVRVEFGVDSMMASVHAFLLLQALDGLGTVLATTPSVDELEGWNGRVVEVVYAAGVEAREVDWAAREVEGVTTVTITTVPEADAKGAGDGDGDGGSEAPALDAAAQPSEDRVVAGDLVASAIVMGQDEPGEAAAPARRGPATVRVDAERLDQLMHHMGELVVHRTQLASLVAESDVPGIGQAMQELERSSQALRAMVMKVRMIEVEAVFARLPRLVRDVAAKLDKEVDLEISGADTELDRTVVDALGDPVVHLVRNALDHGLETVEERIAAGKPAVGTLEISARQSGGGVIITVSDDGRGVNPVAVAKRAAERGLIEPGEELSMARAIDLLFEPGFSTAKEMTDISGRGVGMDAVRDAVQLIGGEVMVHSEVGVGTSTSIRLPLTLAITSALIVEIDGLPFAIPLDRVERTLLLEEQNVRSAAGRDVIVLADQVLPLCDGSQMLGSGDGGGGEHVVIIRAGDQVVALTVGELIGQRELVTRPLPPELKTSRPVSGGAVLADGAIALIVDCDTLADAVPRGTMASVGSAFVIDKDAELSPGEVAG
jgi:two-component system chemotaxis sensor kinase CheA